MLGGSSYEYEYYVLKGKAMINKKEKIVIFESKLAQYFNLNVLSDIEKIDLHIMDNKGVYIKDFEQDISKLINIYKVFGERKKEVWSTDFDEKTENYNLLWLFDYSKIGIYRISMDCISERLEHFVAETNMFFSDNNDKYIDNMY